MDTSSCQVPGSLLALRIPLSQSCSYGKLLSDHISGGFDRSQCTLTRRSLKVRSSRHRNMPCTTQDLLNGVSKAYHILRRCSCEASPTAEAPHKVSFRPTSHLTFVCSFVLILQPKQVEITQQGAHLLVENLIHLRHKPMEWGPAHICSQHAVVSLTSQVLPEFIASNISSQVVLSITTFDPLHLEGLV